MTTRWRNNLLRAIEKDHLLRSPRRVVISDSIVALAGRVDVEGCEVEIAIIVDPLLQHHLPIFLLRPWDALGFIPHIDPSGVICFLDNEGIVFDWRRPLDVVRECFDHVQRTLRDGVKGANHSDFIDEFEVYWQRLEGHVTALADLELPDEATEVIIASSPNADPSFRLAKNAEGLRRVPSSPGEYGPWSASRAIYLPLEAGTTLVPPRSDQPFWNVHDVRRLLAYCSTENRTRLAELIGHRVYKREYLIVRLSRPSGGVAIFGIRFDGVESQHPLANDGDAKQLTPIAIVRRDKYYLVQRGGGHMELVNKRVLLLGCGAVGGHLAFELSRAGVEQLTLVDPDVLDPQNTYRHVLGKRYWGKKKARALEQEIRLQLPFSRVHAVTETIETALATNQINLNEYDLIVSALGTPTSELALNERVHQLEGGPPIIFTWLDPYGIGGHALLTGIKSNIGCFECLYTTPHGSEELYNRASFAVGGQTFRRSLASCDSLHTPYGSLDAAQTAQLATRLAIDVLIEREQQNRLRSWKGDAEAFTTAGFILAPRYSLSMDELARQEIHFASVSCRICGARRNE